MRIFKYPEKIHDNPTDCNSARKRKKQFVEHRK